MKLVMETIIERNVNKPAYVTDDNIIQGEKITERFWRFPGISKLSKLGQKHLFAKTQRLVAANGDSKWAAVAR